MNFQNFNLPVDIPIALASFVAVVTVILICVCIVILKAIKRVEYLLGELDTSIDDVWRYARHSSEANKRIERQVDAINQRTRSRPTRRSFTNDRSDNNRVNTEKSSESDYRSQSRSRRGYNNSYNNPRRFSSTGSYNGGRSDDYGTSKETVDQSPSSHTLDSVADYD